MAGGDYYSCDKCECKTFYDSEVDYSYMVGQMMVLCDNCVKTHEIILKERGVESEA